MASPLSIPSRPGLAERARGRLEERVAVVTGGGDAGDEVPGIGHAIAVLLAQAGARVAIVDSDEAAARVTADRIRSLGGAASVVMADVRSRDSVDAALRAVADHYGSVDVVVNNAAVLGTAHTLEADDEEILKTLDINLMGAIRTSRAALPYMRPGSSITHISSLGAVRTFGKLDYEASKGAINSIVNTMAVEYGGRGIRVNAVSPGQVWSPMASRRLVGLGMSEEELRAHRRERAQGVPLRMEGSGWDIAAAVLFLASEDAAWITGQNLLVDGGQSRVVGYLPHP
jgi:NAD(P)-dependent dehydrogenase (short-subunit alcohol dehydrogenase family)